MPAVHLRIVDRTDPAYEGVWALREEVLRKPLGLSLRDEDLSGEVNETTIVAISAEGGILGCVMLRPVNEQELKLRQMAVATEIQGHGIGNQLLQEAEEFARSSGYRVITLHARVTAVPFYEKAGYVAAGDVFTEVEIPHLLMNKSIHEALP